MDSDEMIGKRIEHLRTEVGLNQGELSTQLRAAGLNWSQGTLSRVETGSRPVRLSEALVLSEVLGVDPAELSPPTHGGFVGMARRAERARANSEKALKAAELSFRRDSSRVERLRLAAELEKDPTLRVRLNGSVMGFLSTISASVSGWTGGLDEALRMLGVPKHLVDNGFKTVLEQVEQTYEAARDADMMFADGIEEYFDGLLDQLTYRPEEFFVDEGYGRGSFQRSPDVRQMSVANFRDAVRDECAKQLFVAHFPGVEFVLHGGAPSVEKIDDDGR